MEELCAHTQMRVNTADELLFVYTFNDDCVLLLIIGRVVEFDRLESGALKDCLSRTMAVQATKSTCIQTLMSRPGNPG